MEANWANINSTILLYIFLHIVTILYITRVSRCLNAGSKEQDIFSDRGMQHEKRSHPPTAVDEDPFLSLCRQDVPMIDGGQVVNYQFKYSVMAGVPLCIYKTALNCYNVLFLYIKMHTNVWDTFPHTVIISRTSCKHLSKWSHDKVLHSLKLHSYEHSIKGFVWQKWF